MTSILQRFLPFGKVFAVRMHKKRPYETGGSTSHPSPSPPTTNSPESRLLSDVIQLVSPMVQAVTGVIPVAGTPLKAAVDVLLCVIQMIDVGPLALFRGNSILIAFQTTKRNKADLDDLASRVHRLSEFLSLEPQPRDEVEDGRRTALAQCVFMLKSFSMSNDYSLFRRLQDTSRKLMKMQGCRGV